MKYLFFGSIWLFGLLWAVACGDDSENVKSNGECSRAALEAHMDHILNDLSTDADFAYFMEKPNGASYSFARGTASLNTPYSSASTSKWVTAATLLRLVDKEEMELSDTPAQYLPLDEWGINENDPLRQITLSQLLSFTSGLIEGGACTLLPEMDYLQCVENIIVDNANNGEVPGATFNYGGQHMQVAGAMAMAATGDASWQQIFDEFKQETGLFSHSVYNLPSTTNPRLASGMTWTGNDYIEFLRAVRDGRLFSNPMLTEQMVSDQIVDAAIGESPALNEIGEDWHYGYGVWIECHADSFNCSEVTRVSCPGAYGAYPFIDYRLNIIGMLARQGDGSTFPEGYAVYDAIRAEAEAWAQCENP